MPTRRMIDPSFWQSESMAKLSQEVRLFFIGLISNADDQGRLKAHPALLRSMIYPYDDISTEAIEQSIEALSAVNSVFVFSSSGRKFIQIINWWDYQSPQWAYPSKIPAPEGWQDRLRYRAEGEVKLDNWDEQGGFIEQSQAKALPKALPEQLGIPIEQDSIVQDKNNKIRQDNNNNNDRFAEICTCYEANIHPLTEIISQHLQDYLEDCPAEWLLKAIKIAAENNVKKWSYIKAILDNWISEGAITEVNKNKDSPVSGDLDDGQRAIMRIAEIIKIDFGGDGDAARRGRDLYFEHPDWDYQRIAQEAIKS